MDVELRQYRGRWRFVSPRKIAGTSSVLAIQWFALSFPSITATAILLVVTPMTWRTGASLYAFAGPVGQVFFSFKSGMARRGPIFLHPRRKEFQVDQIERLAGRGHISHVPHRIEK
jgi:hypothetical protein